MPLRPRADRRRNAQLEFNKANNITPIGVTKKVLDVMEGAYVVPGTRTRRTRGVGEKDGAYGRLDFADTKAVSQKIDDLETQMYEHAKNLAFEEAAATRDKIAELKNHLLNL